jgi:hypothetical protein
LLKIIQEQTSKLSSFEFAEFVAKGIFSEYESEMSRQINTDVQNLILGPARIQRYVESRGYSIFGQPAISLSISSHLLLNYTLDQYIDKLSDINDIIGLWVKDKTSNNKGEIIEIVGKAKDHKERLMATSKRPVMQKIIMEASDECSIVKIHRGYDYPANALQIKIFNRDYGLFKIDAKKAHRKLALSPQFRSELISKCSAILQSKKIIFEHYSLSKDENLFLSSKEIGFSPKIRFRKGTIDLGEDRITLQTLKQYGIYDKKSNSIINAGIISTFPKAKVEGFIQTLQRHFADLDFTLNIIKFENLDYVNRKSIQKSINTIQLNNPTVILGIFQKESEEEDDFEDSEYISFKSIAVGEGIPNQIIEEQTLYKQYAFGNIILGILGKIGNIPYILDEPLPYCDYVVGIDIAREKKKSLPGTINSTAITRIFLKNGVFFKYKIHDAPIQGETVPKSVLQSLFPVHEFENKRVVIHRDGYFRGSEINDLLEWATEINAIFLLVEVIKTGSPRMYELDDFNSIHQPKKGMAFKVSSQDAFLVSSLPPSKSVTPLPIHIRSFNDFSIEEALHSVLSLTLLHYGSERMPKLPVSVHYSDRIGYLAIRGIKPKNLEGEILYWL